MVLFESLLKYKVHIGHSIKNTILFTTWFLYQLRGIIWIINIFKTILFLKIVLRFLKYLINNNLPIWFVNLEVTYDPIFRNYANYCGEFYCTKSWIRGFLSNFKSIQESMNKYILKKYILKSTVKSFFANHWYSTRFTWPRSIFLSNIKSNYIVAKEAGRLNLPMIAVVDTNVKNFLFNIPIPSNSEGQESLCFLISLLSREVLLIKYKKLLNWYTLIKLKKGKFLNKFTNNFEGVVKKPILDILNKKKGSFISLNHFRKLRENMHFFKNSFKTNYKESLVTSIRKLNNKYKSIKKAFVLSYFFKKAFIKLRLRASKAYRKNIKNFIKYSKMSIWYFRKKKRKYDQRIMRHYMTLHLSYILNNFKFSKIFYETFRQNKLVDASIIIPIKHWMTYKQRSNRLRYSNKPLTNYWLMPFFKKFFLKINKWKFYHSNFYFEETYKFVTYIKWYKYTISKLTYSFYNKWFLFLFDKINDLTK